MVVILRRAWSFLNGWWLFRPGIVPFWALWVYLGARRFQTSLYIKGINCRKNGQSFLYPISNCDLSSTWLSLPFTYASSQATFYFSTEKNLKVPNITLIKKSIFKCDHDIRKLLSWYFLAFILRYFNRLHVHEDNCMNLFSSLLNVPPNSLHWYFRVSG